MSEPPIPTITTRCTTRLTLAERRALFVGANLWGSHGLGARKLAVRSPTLHYLREVNGVPVAHVGVVEAVEATVNDWGSVPIIGLGGIVTAEPHRRQGHARDLIEEVLRTALPVDAYAVLFCLDHRQAYYRGLGWHPIRIATVDQPTRTNVPVVYPYYAFYWTARAEPLQTLNVEGLPW